ncbi:MAG TPA: HAD hydrolase-like protein [Streptosporangiaceae bacterium]|nr:HAD hydrolase-like protein [Streptosporangiaceae bacterium]
MLVLWDIDQTLIEVGPTTREAYAAAFRQVAGRELQRPWRFNGRTELAAATEVLGGHGLDPAEGLLERFLEVLVVEYEIRADELTTTGRVLPGAAEALAAVGAVAHQSVLTGNLYRLAVLKMTVFGLADHVDFRIGAYGEDAFERTDLPAFALARAAEHLGLRIEGTELAIIGDTFRDIAAGRAIGARTIGVATGYTSVDDLLAAGADVVLPDLADTDALLAALTRPR